MAICNGPPLLARQPLLTNERAKRRSQSGNPPTLLTLRVGVSLPLAFAVGARISTTVSDGRGGEREGGREGYKVQAGVRERQVLCSLESEVRLIAVGGMAAL